MKVIYSTYINYKENFRGIKTQAYTSHCSCGKTLRRCLTFDASKNVVYATVHEPTEKEVE